MAKNIYIQQLAKSPKSCFERSAVSNLLGNVKLWLKRKNRHIVDVGFSVNVKISEKAKWTIKVDVGIINHLPPSNSNRHDTADKELNGHVNCNEAPI